MKIIEITAADFDLPEYEYVEEIPVNPQFAYYGRKIGWTCSETIGIGIINPRLITIGATTYTYKGK